MSAAHPGLGREGPLTASYRQPISAATPGETLDQEGAGRFLAWYRGTWAAPQGAGQVVLPCTLIQSVGRERGLHDPWQWHPGPLSVWKGSAFMKFHHAKG